MNKQKLTMVSVAITASLLSYGCTVPNSDRNTTPSADITTFQQSIYSSAPKITTQSKTVIGVDGLTFKDLNANDQLDQYEDWRLPTETRIIHLLSQMTLEEKVGMMMISTLNADFNGKTPASANKLINNEKMTRFIFRNPITENPVESKRFSFSGQQITVKQAAEFTNNIQALAESTRLGIPVVFKSNARNHYEKNALAGINTAAGSFSEWPKEAGLAATRDETVLKNFATAMASEWRAIGLRGMYGYMADISTEPRWFRHHETFTENADLANNIISSLVKNLQGGPVTPESGVVLTVKHFPGGGPQMNGLDPHYTFGKYQVYPANQFEQHLKPFIGAINEGVSSIMPYYGIPVDLTYDGVTYEQKGMAFSKEIVTDLLRTKLGFKGYVNSDTGIIGSRAWGLESATVSERIAAAVNAGIDVLSGFKNNQEISDLVKNNLVSESRINDAVSRLLWEQFQLGLFENPYVDAKQAEKIVGGVEFKKMALEAQRKSIVLLQNKNKLLPLPKSTTEKPITLITLGLDSHVISYEKYGSYNLIDAKDLAQLASTHNADFAIVRVDVSNPRRITGQYRSNDKATGGKINPQTKKPWGAEDSKLIPNAWGPDAALDDRLMFGGSAPYDANALSFTEMAKASTSKISPSLAEIQKVMDKVGADKTILSVYFRQPYVMDDESNLKNAGAILASFGVSDIALMDIITGINAPQGKLPFALPSSLAAVLAQDSDAPGYDEEGTLFPFGFGLSY